MLTQNYGGKGAYLSCTFIELLFIIVQNLCHNVTDNFLLKKTCQSSDKFEIWVIHIRYIRRISLQGHLMDSCVKSCFEGKVSWLAKYAKQIENML